MDKEFGLGKCGLLHLEWISNGVLLDGTGDCVQSLRLEQGGDSMKKKKKECVYMYRIRILCCAAEIEVTL